MVDDVDNVVGVEVLEDGDNHRAVGNCCDVAHAPTRVVTADKCNLVAGLDARLLKHKVELGNLLGNLIVRECLALEVVGKSRHLAIVAEALLVNLY